MIRETLSSFFLICELNTPKHYEGVNKYLYTLALHTKINDVSYLNKYGKIIINKCMMRKCTIILVQMLTDSNGISK